MNFSSVYFFFFFFSSRRRHTRCSRDWSSDVCSSDLESTDLPVILYNVPGRTSSNIEPATVARLSKIPNIVGVKEASGSIVQQMEVLTAVERGFRVLSGDDAFTFPLMALGGVGVISVVSNEAPGAMTRLARLLLEGGYDD